MKSESRAIALFAAVGAVLVVVAILASRFWTPTEGVATLPSIPTTAAPLPPAAAPLTAPANDHVTRLLRWPGVSKTQIAFSYAGQLWTVPRDGGEARRLVTGQLQTDAPHFSPDGSMIAYTGMLDENGDVYVVPAAGGEPKRLTYHPTWDEVVGWTPDGTRILFMSWRRTARDLPKLFTVSINGGPPDELPLPSGTTASYSPDGKRLAYVPFQQWQPHWKKYRGGQTTPIWIADLADSHVTKVPRTDSNDRYPMWVGNTVYFVSDRNGPFTLFSYDVGSNAVKELVPNPDGLEIRYASAGPDAIVYERLGEVHLFDVASGKERLVPITVSADLPETRPRLTHVEPDQILHAAVSPTGKRVLFEARGEILAAPAEKGDVRNLTRTPGVADRDPAWSPDGKWIAWLSDDGGEYSLYFRAPDGVNAEKKVSLGERGSYFYTPRWSPDSKKIALWDKRLNLWLVDVEHPKEPTKVDTDMFEGPNFDPSFSPDSRWLAYQKQLANHLTGLFVYSLDDKTIHPLTDGRSAAACPRFDRGGKYLWFFDSTDVGLAATSTMTSMGKPVTSSVYAIVLAKDTPSPVAPQSDEENSDAGAPGGDTDGDDKGKGKDKDKGGKGGGDDKADAKKGPGVKIDFDGIDQRIVALPFDRANYADIETAKGAIFALSYPTVFADEDYLEFNEEHAPPLQVVRFDLKKRKVKPFTEIDGAWSGLQPFVVTADGEKVLFEKDKKWFLAGSDEAPKDLDEAALKSAGGMEVWVDPRAEWKQIYHEVWRIERDFLYDPHAHGLDLAAAEKLYSRYLDGLSCRDDLNAVVGDALGNLVLGHVWMQGGDGPHQDHVNVGLLGADYSIEDGRYRIAKILRGENWNPKLRAPLTEPGVDVKEGDYLLAVNGEELRGDDDVSRLFLGRAGKQTSITVGPKPSLNGSRQVTVVPVGGEGNLRLRGWMEENRKKVDDLSGGKVGYVYVPDTAGGGYTNFNRYYFSQVGKDAVVVDERYNHGGQIADYMVDIMKLQPLMGSTTREGDDVILPAQAIYGPKVMIANEMSGSGGDALPWLFKQAKLGPLVGKRTWGGLVGIGNYPVLVDGGHVTAPRWALYGTHGEWEVENHGIAPDVDVEQDPALTRQGHDPQLEKAVALALEALAKTPPPKLKRPAYVDYGKRLPVLTSTP